VQPTTKGSCSSRCNGLIMKIKIDRENLVYGLNIVTKAVSNKNTVEILGGVEIIAGDQVVSMRGTDLEIELSCKVPTTVEEPGKVVIPAKKFLELARMLPKGDIYIDSVGNHIEIAYDLNRAEINCYVDDQYPKEQDWEKGGTTFILKATDFQKAVKQVQPVSSKEESRPILTGVLLQSYSKGLSLVATDTYRVAWKKLSVTNMPEIRVIIPNRVIGEIAKLPCNSDDQLVVSISSDNSMICFETGEKKLVARLLAGQFPDCARIIPKEATTTVELNKEELLTVTERCSLIAVDDSIIKIDVNGVVRVSAQSQTGTCQETIRTEKQGEDITISCNAHYFLDGLKLNSGEKVTVNFTGALNPAIVKSVDDPDYLYLFMPIRTAS